MPAPDAERAPGARARWVAASGAFLVSLDSIINIAFPQIAAAFGIPPESMRWVIVAYVLTYALVAVGGGALGDVVGHGRVFRAGVALGLAGYALAGLAPSFAWLLAGRVVQGLGGGLVYGTAPGMLTLASPPEARARAVAIFNAAVGLAMALGPLCAGALVGAFGWSAVFLVRVPLAAALLVWAARGAAGAGGPARPALGRPPRVARGPVAVACGLAFVANAGIFAIWLVAPFYLAVTRGLAPGLGGLLFMLAPLAMTIAAPLAGRLADRMGARGLVAGGLVLEAAGLWALGRAGEITPLPALAAAFAVAGLGLGLFQVPNMATVMRAFGPAQQGAAGGLAFMARTLGVVVGVLVLAQLVAVRRPVVGFQPAMAEAFTLAATAVAAAAALALVVLRAPAVPTAAPGDGNRS